jgi:RNAse (barnase) inhibitor barstar
MSKANPAPNRWRIELKGKSTREAMLKAVAAGLAFPAHFGANLDALYDCLTDLPLAPGHEHAIELANLARSPAGDAVHTVFADAAEYWREQGVTLLIRRD